MRIKALAIVRAVWDRIREWFYWWQFERPLKRRKSVPPPPPPDLFDAEVKMGEAWRPGSIQDRDD